MRSLGLLCIAFFSSTAGAISGIGGGIIIKPVLDAVLGTGVHEINFLSGCTVLAMALVSVFQSRKGAVKLELKRGTALALGAVLGGLAGKLLFSLALAGFPHVSMVGAVQSVILILMTGMVLVYVLKKKDIKPRNIHRLSVCLLLGLSIGMVSAFLGIGGGPINIMIISYFMSMDSKTTALHSLYAVFLSQLSSLALTVLTRSVPPLEPLNLAAMITGGVLGGLLGSAAVKKLAHHHVDKCFGAVLTAVLLISIYNLTRYIFP
jgi:uncharacterized membrane protein YfcA